MYSIAKTLTAIILIAVSLLIAYVTVRILGPFLPIIVLLILLYFILLIAYVTVRILKPFLPIIAFLILLYFILQNLI